MSPEASIALVGGKAQGARTDAKFGHARQLDIGDEYAQQRSIQHSMPAPVRKNDKGKRLEAEEEKGKAMLHQAQAAMSMPNEIQVEESIIKLQKDALTLDKLRAEISNQQSETQRNIPEMDHLKSETILNLAKAREAGAKSVINTTVQ